MTEIIIPRGDKGFNVDFTIQDSAGTAYNLTGYTVTLKFWKEGQPETTGGRALTILTAADGTCRYAVVAGDFAIAEEYLAEIELTKADVIESTATFKIVVKESP